MRQQLNRKKILTLTILLLVAGTMLYIFLSYSWLTITSNSDETKSVYIRRGEEFKFLEITKESRTIFLKRDTYSIEVNKDERTSLYHKPLGFFKNELKIELMDQKVSNYIGKSDLPCGKLTEAGTTIFYSCKPSELGLISTHEISQLNSRPFVEVNNQQQDHANENEPDPSISSLSLDNYKGNFLEARRVNKTLLIKDRDESGYLSGQVQMPEFGGEVTDGKFATSQDSDNFAVFNTSKNEINSFKNLNDKNALTAKVEGDKINKENYSIELLAAKNYTYLINYNVELDQDDDQPGDLGKDVTDKDQKILVYDSSTLKLVKEHGLSDKWFLRNITPGPENKTLFFLSGNLNDQVILLENEAAPKRIETLAGAPQEACWKDNDSFYYIADGGSRIYMYSIPKQASFLLLGPLREGVSANGLNCNSGNLTYKVEAGADGEVDSFHYFKLDDIKHTGTRTEEVLPFYFDLGDATYKSSIVKGGIKIESVVDGAVAADGPRPQLEETVKKRLSESGANTNNILFVY